MIPEPRFLRLFLVPVICFSLAPVHAQNFVTGFQNRVQNATLDSIPTIRGIRIIRVSGNRAKDFWEKSDDEKTERTALLSGAFRDAIGSLYTELLTDRINRFKTALGSTLSAVNDPDTAKSQTLKNLQSLINGGGNLFFRLQYPLSVIEHATNPELINCTFLLTSRAATNVPVLGNSSSAVTWNGDVCFEMHGYAMGINNKIGIMGRLRMGILGGNDQFLNRIITNKKLLNPYNQFSLAIHLKGLGLMVSVDSPVRFFLKAQRRNDNSASIGIGYQL